MDGIWYQAYFFLIVKVDRSLLATYDLCVNFMFN